MSAQPASPFNIPPHITPEGSLQQPMTKPQALDILASYPTGPALNADSLEWTNYGAALYLSRRDEEALHAVRRAVSLSRNATTLLNLGVVLEGFGRFAESLQYYEEAHALDPISLMTGGAFADGLLRMGRWKEGWPLYSLYHSRLLIEKVPTLAELHGKRIILIKNGKIGDNIYHLRWLRFLREAGCNITYVCDRELIPLFEGHPWIDRLLVAPKHEGVIQWYVDGSPTHDLAGTLHFNLREFDYILSVMSLPTIVNQQFPQRSWPGRPYITTRAPWYHRFLPSRKPRVGICWKAGEEYFQRAHRSLSTPQRDLLLRDGEDIVHWVSLVPDADAPSDIERLPLRDWKDTARAIATCDLVITVDTGVAHLAGAMGKRVWVILSGASAWQYGLDNQYHLVYPSMHAFRNDGVGTDKSLDRCRRALRNLHDSL